ncbi:MAG: MarR family winged helix-turn-helix transcriptional regulator [Woeseiaceae bacterium]|nr:MarR family winged helix-turn-helix transcriptional regulator [Woeseiaceae bacterium]
MKDGTSVQLGSGAEVDSLYTIEQQVGFLLRRTHQRSTAIFQNLFAESGLTPLQFASLMKIRDQGRASQNLLGRLTYADPATIMGVINRLVERGLIRKSVDPDDKRKSILILTSKGLNLIESLETTAREVSRETLAPLSPDEQKTFLLLLAKLT